MLLLPAEAFQKSGGSRMYTFEPPILYSEAALRGAFSGQHPLHFRFALAFSRRGAIRFLLWWLYLHRRLRSRQRGPTLSDRTTSVPFRMIISIRLRPFLSGRITSPCGFASPSLSASTPGVQDSGFPLLLSANGVSPPPFHLPVPVKMPVSNLDCEAILHPKK
jgi:hypothetical protein